MAQPPGFVDSDHPLYACKLHKAIYGLKRAPLAWYYELRQFLLASGFKNSHSDTSLFVLHSNNHVLYLLVYVDNIILTGSNGALVSQFVDYLAQRFSLKDLGSLSYFLGVEVVPPPSWHSALPKKLHSGFTKTNQYGQCKTCSHSFTNQLSRHFFNLKHTSLRPHTISCSSWKLAISFLNLPRHLFCSQ